MAMLNNLRVYDIDSLYMITFIYIYIHTYIYIYMVCVLMIDDIEKTMVLLNM